MNSIEKVVQKLILNGTLTECPGLYYGKTGIAVFFFHYARQTENELFRNYAMDLVEEIQQQITVTISARYDVGLAGIGTGFEYILQNDFLEAEDDHIFENFDARMYRAAMYEPYSDLGLEGGLTGWGRYFICRLQGNGLKDDKLHKALTHIANDIAQKIEVNMVPENEQPDVFRFFHDLMLLPEYGNRYIDLLRQCREWNCFRKPNKQEIFPFMENLQRQYTCQTYLNMDLTKEIEKEWDKWKETDISTLKDMGLLKGWTAAGLLYLTSFCQQDISWLKLL